MQTTCRRCGRSMALSEITSDSMGKPICKSCAAQKPASAAATSIGAGKINAAASAALSMIAKSAMVTAQTPKKDSSATVAASKPSGAGGMVGRKAPVVSKSVGGSSVGSSPAISRTASGPAPASRMTSSSMGSSSRMASAPARTPSAPAEKPFMQRPTSSVSNKPGPSQQFSEPVSKDGAYKCSKCGYSFKPSRSNPKVYVVCPFCKGPIIR